MIGHCFTFQVPCRKHLSFGILLAPFDFADVFSIQAFDLEYFYTYRQVLDLLLRNYNRECLQIRLNIANAKCSLFRFCCYIVGISLYNCEPHYKLQ